MTKLRLQISDIFPSLLGGVFSILVFTHIRRRFNEEDIRSRGQIISPISRWAQFCPFSPAPHPQGISIPIEA